jgi:hypothetical protein
MAAILAPAGLAGFLFFCTAFPNNAIKGWRRVIVGLAPILAVPYVSFFLYEEREAIRFQFRPPFRGDYLGGIGDPLILTVLIIGIVLLLKTYLKARGPERQQTRLVILAFAVTSVALFVAEIIIGLPAFSIFLLGAAIVLITYFSTDGLERHRINWVIFGFFCAFAATTVDFVWGRLSFHPAWYIRALELLYVILPLTVAYAVIRHRVIDVRFLASRSIAIGVIATIIGLVFAFIDWIFSTRLPNTRLEMAAYAGMALLVGFWLNVARQRIGTTIDFLLFRPWYQAQERLRGLDDVIHRARSPGDLYEPLTSGVADALSVASAAMFERMESAGFVRVAAFGWPAGTVWHVLPDDPLAVRLSDRPRIVDPNCFPWTESEVPSGVARPAIVLPMVSGRRVPAFLVYGAHADGTGLAPDEIRLIRRLSTDACLLYGKPSEADPMSLLGQQSEPLGA